MPPQDIFLASRAVSVRMMVGKPVIGKTIWAWATASSGELLMVSEMDLQAFDVIGWSRAIPEPGSSMVLVGLSLLAIAKRRRQRV